MTLKHGYLYYGDAFIRRAFFFLRVVSDHDHQSTVRKCSCLCETSKLHKAFDHTKSNIKKKLESEQHGDKLK